MNIYNTPGSKVFSEGLKPHRSTVADDELRARLQECQRAGQSLAANAIERELAYRKQKDEANVTPSS